MQISQINVLTQDILNFREFFKYDIVGDKSILFVIMAWNQAVDKLSSIKERRLGIFHLGFVVHLHDSLEVIT